MTTCEVCGGRGWRTVETAERSFAERCDCWRAAERERRLDRAGIPAGLRHCDLASFDLLNPRLEKACSRARNFVESYPLGGGTGLLFHGPVGTGKTHLAVAIVQALVLTKGVRARFLDFRGLLKTIQESWNPVSESSEKQVLDGILGADVLALDDLGAERASDWVRETVGYLINERYVRAKPLVITTNLRYETPSPGQEEARAQLAAELARSSSPQVEYLEDRIGIPSLSRLCEMCVPVDLTGVGDYRSTVKLYGARG